MLELPSVMIQQYTDDFGFPENPNIWLHAIKLNNFSQGAWTVKLAINN